MTSLPFPSPPETSLTRDPRTASKLMNVISKTESKLLGRTDVEVLFPARAGALNRRDAVKEVAQALNAEENRVSLVMLDPEAGTRNVRGHFRVYATEDAKNTFVPRYLTVRLMTKEEREALKQARKKAEQAAAQQQQQAAGKPKGKK